MDAKPSLALLPYKYSTCTGVHSLNIRFSTLCHRTIYLLPYDQPIDRMHLAI